jgi:signal transduction histidine kinase
LDGADAILWTSAELAPPVRTVLSRWVGDRLGLILEMEEARRDNAAKDDFLSVTSHELRTPLSTILGWAKILLDEKEPNAERTRKGLETIYRNSNAEAKLIDDMLDQARLLRRRIRIEGKPQLLAPLVDAALEPLAKKAAERGVELQLDLSPEVRAVVDKARFEQLVAILVANALDHGRAASGTTRATIQLGAELGKARVRISDSAGMSPKELVGLFDRLRAEPTKRHGGHGLGLVFASRLAELMQATLLATSEGKGRGSTFTLELPLAT